LTARAEKKPSPDFSGEGQAFNSLRCYFLQQQQQSALLHSLPLAPLSFGGVCAVAVPIKATRLRINRRYFINSSFDFRMEFGYTI
jgi:hypothetical protein